MSASSIDQGGNSGVTEAAMRRALARARDGKPLDHTEATVLLHARGDDLDTLLRYARRTRDAGLEAAGRPGIITYSKKVFIPLTRLCRDRCAYCTFATVPKHLDSPFLSPDEVLDIAREGARLGCKEALFTLGDRPEARWRQAREWLDAHGYDDTLSYVRAMAIRVLEETGLLPHLNPGVLTWQDFQRLKPVAPSMGMMLETTATRLFTDRMLQPHGLKTGDYDYIFAGATSARFSAPSIEAVFATTSTRRSLGNRPRANVGDASAIATTATGTLPWLM